ncbi:MAG: c-type cytochrome [Acidobacteriales bacterium]|nr:c-type cytochrome [Candidatus Koribacter versatilis]MBI3644434.1 c-type cytochrome [Terriglobales bacterium]
MRTRRNHWTILIVVIAVAMLASAQEQPKKEIKHVAIKPTSAASGQEMYKNYCAVCHGTDGAGNGPAAPALKVPSPDLTVLAQKNGGKYPALKVAAVIRGEEVLPAHGSKEMPIWGNLFWSMSGGHSSEVQQRVANLNKYIESLQKK